MLSIWYCVVSLAAKREGTYLMAHYVEFLEVNCITGKLYRPCGDRSIVKLDSRNRTTNMISDSIAFNGKFRPVYEAFQIFEGKLNSKNYHAITPVIYLS